MLRIRPYKSCDAQPISDWLGDELTYKRWGGDHIGAFPLSAEMIDRKYSLDNGDCSEKDNFYPQTAVDEDNTPVGSFIIRYTQGDSRQLRFGWVVVDASRRGCGIGGRMLTLGLKYAFEILGADRVTIGAFENNPPARGCYTKIGFREVETVSGEPWNVVEMEILREEYFGKTE